jgi:hypothetical protein
MLEKTCKAGSGRFRNCEKVLFIADRLKMLNSGGEGDSSLCLRAEVSLP